MQGYPNKINNHNRLVGRLIQTYLGKPFCFALHQVNFKLIYYLNIM